MQDNIEKNNQDKQSEPQIRNDNFSLTTILRVDEFESPENFRVLSRDKMRVIEKRSWVFESRKEKESITVHEGDEVIINKQYRGIVDSKSHMKGHMIILKINGSGELKGFSYDDIVSIEIRQRYINSDGDYSYTTEWMKLNRSV